MVKLNFKREKFIERERERTLKFETRESTYEEFSKKHISPTPKYVRKKWVFHFCASQTRRINLWVSLSGVFEYYNLRTLWILKILLNYWFHPVLFLIMFLIYFTHRHYFCLTRWYLNFTGTTISSIFLVFYGNIPCQFMEDVVHWKKVQYYNDTLKSKLSLPKIQNREKVSIKFITKPKIKMWLKP